MLVVCRKLDMSALCEWRKEQEGALIGRGNLQRFSPLFYHIECSCWNLWENDSEWTLAIIGPRSALVCRLANHANALSLLHTHTKALCVSRSTEGAHISLYHSRGISGGNSRLCLAGQTIATSDQSGGDAWHLNWIQVHALPTSCT